MVGLSRSTVARGVLNRTGGVDWIRKGNMGLIVDVDYGGRSVKVVGVGVNSAQMGVLGA